ncbi:MAG TPA: helix-turn-helix domain-containing protein [Candidatus Salinicoccus stercoripullorum]|uniref:Helix-turn-helix domain-containing protein n=1 Tax=Candidatus Salinicoccus stercoripullorum TaxID=2838756 RepID=A0A9D1QJJ0_9STAP|nr:helix-turn-helix domain-containing protein [Candidatus Salinicoccus stercoripullorum]
MALGGRIRSIRKSKKMTLADLAGGEITKGMMSLIENGKSKPSMETLQHIARTLDVSVSHLMQEGDDVWTESILEYEGFTDNFNFPYAFIEEEILKNLDKVAQNSRGMEVYNILRMYYRMKGKHEIADEYPARVDAFLEGRTVKNASAKYYRNIFELELTYFQEDYQEVVDGYRDDMYIRPLAQHPIDRIIMAVRSSVYPLSLHHLGREEEARAEFEKIEETIEDISDSVFTKEFYMIKDIIFEK